MAARSQSPGAPAAARRAASARRNGSESGAWVAAGAPIVASDIPVFRELAEGVALFFPPGDPQALARAVEDLDRDPQATTERIARGHQVAEQEYTWKRSIDAICQVFERALASA